MRTLGAILFFILGAASFSCSGPKSGGTTENDIVEVQTKEIRFPQQDVLQLKSYYLSSSIHEDSVDIIVGYNYRLHCLDYINLESKQVTQTMLPANGPDAINRVSGLYAHSLDSVWVSDESGCAFLVDSKGIVKSKLNLMEYIKEGEQILINTNYAIQISHLYYNKLRQSLMFLIQDMSAKTFAVKEVFANGKGDANAYKLLPSNVIPDMSEGYGFMNCPNVNYVDNTIIYNYPVESSIYTLNILTNARTSIKAESSFTPNVVGKCQGKGYSELEKHRLENPYFYDVMYIPYYKMYARLHIDGVEYDAERGIDKMINDRDLYLMLFNDGMEKVGEVKLAKHRYNFFTGWGASYSGIVLFVDNMLDPANDTDDLTLDLISPE